MCIKLLYCHSSVLSAADLDCTFLYSQLDPIARKENILRCLSFKNKFYCAFLDFAKAILFY